MFRGPRESEGLLVLLVLLDPPARLVLRELLALEDLLVLRDL